MNIEINAQPIALNQLRLAWQEPLQVSIGPDAWELIAASQKQIDKVLGSGERVYGVNTGFGQLAQVRISDDELVNLQENLGRSHAVGVGEPLS